MNMRTLISIAIGVGVGQVIVSIFVHKGTWRWITIQITRIWDWIVRQINRLFSRVLGPWQRWRQRYECMGFDVSDREAPGIGRVVAVQACNKKLKRSQVHVLIDNSDEQSITGENRSGLDGAQTAVVRELCEVHCVGGCNKDCEVKTDEDSQV